MLPGKRYTPDDILAIARRRVWFVLVPVSICAAVAALWARTLPDEYYSETVIQVVPQRVPESFVRSTVTQTIEERLPAISETIQSRSRLASIIDEFDLYPAERTTWLMEDVIELMESDIEVDIIRGDAFVIGYSGPNPVKAQQVATRLSDLVIAESLRDRERLAEGTDQFLEVELQDARAQLRAAEGRLEQYRQDHAGELPSELDSNLQQLHSVGQQIQSTVDSTNRLLDRRLLLERSLTELRARPPSAGPVVATPDGTTVTGGTAGLLAAAQAELAAQRQRGLLPDHPDLQATERRIEDLATRLREERAAAAGSETVDMSLSPSEIAYRDQLDGLTEEVAEIDRQIARGRLEETRLRDVQASLQERVDRLPRRESELIDITRDYDTLEDSYNNLLAKKQEAQIAANLERRQVGEQFRVLETALVPERPVSPDRPRIYLVGAAAGALLGIGLIVGLEYRNRAFTTDEDVAAVLDLPVLAVVPTMESATDQRASHRRRVALTAGLGSLVVASTVVFIYAIVA